jgi:tetratricopeptide (TPR) repeat protein
MYKDAIAEYEKALPNDDHGIFLAALGRSFALAGDSRKAADVKHKIEHFSGKDFMWPYDAALFYAALGDKDRAFEWLEKDEKMRDGWLLFLRVDPRLSPLRSDPRLAELARRTGLPQ